MTTLTPEVGRAAPLRGARGKMASSLREAASLTDLCGKFEGFKP